VELLERKKSVVNRVAMRSSTRNQPDSNNRVRRTRSRKKPESSSSDSDRNEVAPEPIGPIVHLEKGVEENRLPIDISSVVGRAIADSNPKIAPKTVRFDDVPVVIKSNPDIQIDEYDIIRDIKDQKVNVAIGQLLHDNTNYQKLIREAWTRRQKKKFKLPSVAVNFSQPEDSGAPEVTVEVEGCSIPKVRVDGGSGVNLMLEETAFDLLILYIRITGTCLSFNFNFYCK
jgi:Fe-S-cluster formation regulator IscX/YfhJ